MTDIVASCQADTDSNLKASLLCMELSQMLVQGVWLNQSPLLQLPFLSKQMLEDLKHAQIKDISDFMNMDDD